MIRVHYEYGQELVQTMDNAQDVRALFFLTRFVAFSCSQETYNGRFVA